MQRTIYYAARIFRLGKNYVTIYDYTIATTWLAAYNVARRDPSMVVVKETTDTVTVYLGY